MEKNKFTIISPLNELDFYVENPKLIEDPLGSYTSYTMKGKRIKNSIERRYKEFDYLRIKIQEKFPGIIIPNLPHKQIIGEKQKKIIDMRIEQINRFCYKISKLPFYNFISEIEVFLQNSNNDIIKSLDNINKENYFEISNKYEKCFGQIPQDFNSENCKNKHINFIENLKIKNKKINDLIQLINSFKNQYQKTIENYDKTINAFSSFENGIINEYADNKKNKLIFSNSQNNDLNEKINEIKKLSNPYNELLDNINENLLDNESIIEAYNNIINLEQYYLKNKNKEQDNHNIIGLEKIIKYDIWLFEKEINNFKSKNLKYYYYELSQLIKSFKNNNILIDNIINSLLTNTNLTSL